MHWLTTRFDIDLTWPQVMGIVNVTPDSFFDGGQHASESAAMAHCDALVEQGAQLLDIGGESTRPGANSPTLQEELARVLPVLRHAVSLGVPVSVDTSRPEVMQAALDLGVDIVNDVRALQRPGALAALAAHPRAGLCLMHMQGEPGNMQASPHYLDVVTEVSAFLQKRLRAAVDAGISAQRVVLDPGIGFAKTAEHNLALLARQHELLILGAPLLVGWSRKSTLGVVTGRAAPDRLPASLAAALLAVQRGARVLRVHDVAASVDVLKIWRADQVAANPNAEQAAESQPTPGP
jgi:dihydropteroate synthase